MAVLKEHQELELKDVLRNVLEEARMVLPGIQALFGFQLVAVFNAAFKDIPVVDRFLHFIALMLTIGAIGCLMAPASYHRQVERGCVSQQFIDYASKLLCIGMIPLLLSIALDTYVVCNAITEAPWIACVASVLTLLLLSTLWYVVPSMRRKEHDCKHAKLVDPGTKIGSGSANQTLSSTEDSNLAA